MFALRPGISFCVVDGKSIFLDQNKDRYFGLPAEVDNAFQNAVLTCEGDVSTLLSAHPALGAFFNQTEVSTVRTTEARLEPAVSDFTTWPDQQPTLSSVAEAFVFQLHAAYRMKHWPLSKTLVATGFTGQIRQAREPAERAKQIAAAYRTALKIITSENRCLRRSVGLQAHLRSAGVPSKLIIGVKVRPFAAHAWVQTGTCVVNDRIENTNLFTAIAVI